MSDNKAWSSSSAAAGNSTHSGASVNGGKSNETNAGGVTPVAPEFLRSFVGVVRSYLPEIQREIEELYGHPQPTEPLAEAFRHLRSIKGAAAMLGLASLSEIADQFELTLRGIAANRATLTMSTLISLSQIIALFNAYLERGATGVWDAPTSLSESLRRLQRPSEERELPRTTASLSPKTANLQPPAATETVAAAEPLAIPEPPLLNVDSWAEQPPFPNSAPPAAGLHAPRAGAATANPGVAATLPTGIAQPRPRVATAAAEIYLVSACAGFAAAHLVAARTA